MPPSMSAEELEFVQAIENFKKENSKHFLSWTEVLSIVKELGYKKSELHRKKKKQPASKAAESKVKAG